MPLCLREQRQHAAEQQSADEQHADAGRLGGAPVSGHVIERPGGQDQQHEDDEHDDQRDEEVDAAAREVVDVGVVGLAAGFVAAEEVLVVGWWLDTALIREGAEAGKRASGREELR